MSGVAGRRQSARLIGTPFDPWPNETRPFFSRSFADAQSAILGSVRRQAPLILLRGDVGVGRTTLLRHLAREPGAIVNVMVVNGRDVDDLPSLLRAVQSLADGETAVNKQLPPGENPFLALVRPIIAARGPILIAIDDADLLPAVVLVRDFVPAIGAIADAGLPCTLLLVGNEVVRGAIDRAAALLPSAEPVVEVTLLPLDADQIGDYAAQRYAAGGHAGVPPFTPAALARIFRLAQGLPSKINRLCAACLDSAERGDGPIDTQLVMTEFARAYLTGGLMPPRPEAAPAAGKGQGSGDGRAHHRPTLSVGQALADRQRLDEITNRLTDVLGATYDPAFEIKADRPRLGPGSVFGAGLGDGSPPPRLHGTLAPGVSTAGAPQGHPSQAHRPRWWRSSVWRLAGTFNALLAVGLGGWLWLHITSPAPGPPGEDLARAGAGSPQEPAEAGGERAVIVAVPAGRPQPVRETAAAETGAAAGPSAGGSPPTVPPPPMAPPMPPPMATSPNAGGEAPAAAPGAAGATSGDVQGPPATPSPGAVGTGKPAPVLDPQWLLARGNEMLAQGDFAAAQLFYRQAAEQGYGPAARAMAGTYDPLVSADRGIPGVRIDAAKAVNWYREALRLGDPGAQAPLDRLLAHLQQKG